MQGVHVINDPNGQPAVLTIDLHSIEPDVSPLVDALLARISPKIDNPAPAPEYEYAATIEEERREFLDASGILANRAYGDDEPEYTVADLKWINPNFSPDATH